jgi:hypothetical protein
MSLNKNMCQNQYPVIVLDENEMFRNEKGEVCRVDVRGERALGKCFFHVKDIGRVFGIKRLSHDIMKAASKYIEGTHYIRMTLGGSTPQGQDPLYFTYRGMMTWLYSARDDKTLYYLDWIEQTLFTIQMGTTEAKQELIETLDGFNIDSYKKFSEKCVNDIKCVYLFTLGTVGALRESMNINEDYGDNMMVVKYGLTKNLERRFEQHKRDYEKYDGCDINLQYYAMIDGSLLYTVENKIKKHLNKYELHVEGRRELLCMSSSRVNKTKKVYTKLVDIVQDEIKQIREECEEKSLRKLNKYLNFERHLAAKEIERVRREANKARLTEFLDEINRFSISRTSERGLDDIVTK